MKNQNLVGGLFDGRGKPQPLRAAAKAKQIVTPEKSIQMSFIAWRDMFRRQFPILNAIFSVPNGMWAQNAAVALAQIKNGLTKGISDIICLAPSHDRKFYALLIEFKTADEKKSVLTDEQRYFHEFFADLGYRTEVCRSAHAAAQLVNEHLGIRVPVYPR